MTAEELMKYTEATINTTKIVIDAIEREHELAVSTTKNVLTSLEKIELKQRCLRVRLLDWLSDKLLAWSEKTHEMAVKIDSPCVIKLPESKKPATKFGAGYTVKLGKNK